MKRFGNEERHEIRFHLFERVRVVLQRFIKIATILRSIHAKIVADFMPQRAIEVTIGREIFGLLLADRRCKRARASFENSGVAHDVCPQQYRAAISARQVTLVRQNRRRVSTTRLPEIRHDVINTYRNVFAHLLVILIGQRIFERLQPLHRLAQGHRFLLPGLQQAEREERLHTK